MMCVCGDIGPWREFQEEGAARDQGDSGFRCQGYGSSARPPPCPPILPCLGICYGVRVSLRDLCLIATPGLSVGSEQQADYYAGVMQGTKDVRLDPQLNKKVWEAGIKGVPFRLRVRISRKRNDEDGAKERLYSYVQAVNVKNPKGLSTVVVEES